MTIANRGSTQSVNRQQSHKLINLPLNYHYFWHGPQFTFPEHPLVSKNLSVWWQMHTCVNNLPQSHCMAGNQPGVKPATS